jgi:tetratricopeptide (TPR) repeat protein
MRTRTRWIAVSLALVATAATADDSPPELYRRSYAAEAKGEYASALAAHEQVGLRGQRGYVYELRRGWLLYLAGRHADAAAAYDQAAQLEPTAVEPRLGAMLPLMAQRRWKEAQGRGQEVLVRAPGDLTAQSRLAWIQYVQGRYAEAETYYRKALAAYPANVDLRAGLGWSLLKQGRTRDAAAEFTAVLNVAPDQASAKEGRAALN